jgi:hypothetical protein
VLPDLVVLGAGIGLNMAIAHGAATAGVDADDTGVASATVATANQVAWLDRDHAAQHPRDEHRHRISRRQAPHRRRPRSRRRPRVHDRLLDAGALFAAGALASAALVRSESAVIDPAAAPTIAH